MSMTMMLESPDYDNTVSLQVASNAGWNAAAVWMASLPNQYNSVRELGNSGHGTNTANLARQLVNALSAYPPEKQAVRHTIEGMIRSLDGGSPVESLTVTP